MQETTHRKLFKRPTNWASSKNQCPGSQHHAPFHNEEDQIKTKISRKFAIIGTPFSNAVLGLLYRRPSVWPPSQVLGLVKNAIAEHLIEVKYLPRRHGSIRDILVINGVVPFVVDQSALVPGTL